MTSHDYAYKPGDIHYENCSQTANQGSIGWCPDPHDINPSVQVDFGHYKAVHGIKFQTIYSSCTVDKHDYRKEAFMSTFDLEYTIAGDPEKNWVLYSENLPALNAAGPERMYEFSEPLVTASFRIIPKLHNIYPCFRFSVLACEASDLCMAGWCLNGGQCSGKNMCTCSQGYYGERCNASISDIEPENYDFLEIKNNTLETPDATFDVVGNVTLDSYRKRDSHHGHHGHSIHCQGHNSYVQHRYSHYHHYHHGRRSSHHGTCMSHLGHHSHGYTTSMHVHFGHHHSHSSHHSTCVYSHGGTSPGHQGSSLHYYNNHLHYNVQSASHHWSVSAPCNLHNNQWHHIQSSWHPHTGVSLYVNNQHIGSSSHAHPHSYPHTQTVPLRLCHDHHQTNVYVNVNINIQISGLNMLPVSQHQLTVAGMKGPYTVPPPTTLPPTTLSPTTLPSTLPTTPTPSTTTRAPVSATTTVTHTQGTTGPHRSVCYNCTSESSLGNCKSTVRCQVGEVCVLFQDRTGYTSKCLDKQLCLNAKGLSGGSCWECCESYLCNDHCLAHTNATCADKSSCSTLINTGYNVCKDPKMAVDICRKTCNKC